MGIYETFSNRQKKLSKQGKSDPYRYDIFPKPLRVQVIKLLGDTLGDYWDPRGDRDRENAPRWEFIHETLAHEYGVFELANGKNDRERCHAFFLEANSVEECLDFVELSFRQVQQLASYYAVRSTFYEDKRKHCEDTIIELNYRLREHSLGYQLEEGKIIRVDSQFIHAEIVKPALVLLHEIGFAGASEEFLQAHEHYRAKRYPEAIAGALKAFESTMKGICDLRKWVYPGTTTAKGLIQVIFSK